MTSLLRERLDAMEGGMALDSCTGVGFQGSLSKVLLIVLLIKHLGFSVSFEVFASLVSWLSRRVLSSWNESNARTAVNAHLEEPARLLGLVAQERATPRKEAKHALDTAICSPRSRIPQQRVTHGGMNRACAIYCRKGEIRSLLGQLCGRRVHNRPRRRR